MFTPLLLAGAMWLAGTTAQAIEKSGGVYRIGTAQDLADFAALVNGGERAADAVLTADIDYSGQTAVIGTGTDSDKAYAGTFDGAGHKVTLALTSQGVGKGALFLENAGVIRDLVVDGTVTTAYKQCGGIAAYNAGVIQNCVSLVTIVTTVTDDATAGGVCGGLRTNGLVDHCVFAGRIEGASAHSCGGVVGWVSNASNIASCLNAGTFAINMSANSSAIARNSQKNCPAGRFRDNYSLAGFGGTVDGAELSADDLAGGRAAHLLGMGQLLGTDALPSPLSPHKVYAVAASCADQPTGYTNDPALAAPHAYADGVCSVCGQADPDYVTATDGVYRLSTARELAWFSRWVNQGHVTAGAQLEADIDLAGVPFTPIGNDTTVYCGTFDGRHHVISGLVVDAPDATNVGLFGSAGAASKIRDLAVDATCAFTGRKHVGGVIGHNTHRGAWCEMSGLTSAARVTATPVSEGGDKDAGVGGIIGNCNDSSYGLISHCAFSGSVSGTSAALISGWCGTNQYTVSGCWSVAPAGVDFVRASSGRVALLDCYSKGGTQVPRFTDEEMAGGQLCWLLNGQSSQDPAWRQTLGADAAPSLTSPDIVYKVGTLHCDGSQGEGFGFSNADTGFSREPHHIDSATGLCSVCGQPDAAPDGYLLIPTAQALRWVADSVNRMTQPKPMDLRLTADIDLRCTPDSLWTPIGESDAHLFRGRFDGGRHRVSNMIVDKGTATCAGLFGSVQEGTFSDVLIDATCSVAGGGNCGGLIGHSNSGRVDIDRVGVMCDVTSTGGNTAGIIGGANGGSVCNISRSFVTGTISGAKETALFSGWEGNVGAAITDCWATGSVTAGYQDAAHLLARGTLAVTRCYTTAPLATQSAGQLPSAPEALSGGELCHFLNTALGDTVWYQTLGQDTAPLPWDNHLPVYANGAMRCDGAPLEGELTYSNTPGAELPPHQYDHGICAVCGGADPAYLTPVAGYYELASGGDLLWFSLRQNAKGEPLCARLTADIDMDDLMERFVPLGTGTGYAGQFDGQGHRVSNFVLEARDKSDIGFIALAADGMSLRNIVFDATCSITASKYAALVAANLSGEKGTVTVENVGMEGDVTCLYGENAAAIVGCDHGSGAVYHISGCYATGNISGTKESAALAAWVGSKGSTLTNCWSSALVEGVDEQGNDLYRGSNVTVTRLFGAGDGAQGTRVEREDVASGRLAWLLNGSSFASASWYQRVGEDLHPTHAPASGIVYATDEGFATVHDGESYLVFLTRTIAAELQMADTAVACQTTLDAYRSQVESWEDTPSLDAFLALWRAAQPQRAAVADSRAAYAAYEAEAASTRAYLAGVQMDNEHSRFLEAYLDEASPLEPDSAVYPNGSYAWVVERHVLTDAQIADETAYLKTLLTRVIAHDPQPGMDITAILPNADLRDGTKGWECDTSGGALWGDAGPGLLPAVEAYDCDRLRVSQTLRGLKPGIYMLSANAVFRPYSDPTSRYSTATLFMNGNVNMLPTESEDMVLKADALDGENCHLTGSNTDYQVIVGEDEGWVPMGPLGASYAFAAGRYLCSAAVRVDEGDSLTLGIQNSGTGIRADWTCAGGFRLFYLGTDDEAAQTLANVMENYVARATTIRDFMWTDTDEAAKYPNYWQSLKDRLDDLLAQGTQGTGAELMERVDAYSVLFRQIRSCRKAYAGMTVLMERKQEMASQLYSAGLLDAALYDAAMQAVDDHWAAYQEGSYSEEDALRAMEQLNALRIGPATDAEGTFMIASTDDLRSFAMMVNSGLYDANAALTADLDLAGVDYTPIGWNLVTDNKSVNDAVAYRGHFDGGGHRVSHLTLERPEAIGVGFFGTVAPPARIERLVLDATCRITGKDRAGLVGRTTGGGDVWLDRLGMEGDVLCDKAAAGILGNANNGTWVSLRNCYSSGTVGTLKEGLVNVDCAQICGWLGGVGAEVSNCWSVSPVTGYQMSGFGDAPNDRTFCRGNSIQFSNCYSNFSAQVTLMPDDAFRSGEVTWRLNERCDSTLWYQNLGEDAHPVLDPSHSVVVRMDDGSFTDLETGIARLDARPGTAVTVYDAQGRVVRSGVLPGSATQGLRSGLYILRSGTSGFKVLVR